MQTFLYAVKIKGFSDAKNTFFEIKLFFTVLIKIQKSTYGTMFFLSLHISIHFLFIYFLFKKVVISQDYFVRKHLEIL